MTDHSPESEHWRLAQEARLADAFAVLGPVAREVLCRIGERLVLGRQRYGRDLDDDRDWRTEAIEEVLDASIYLTRSHMP